MRLTSTLTVSDADVSALVTHYAAEVARWSWEESPMMRDRASTGFGYWYSVQLARALSAAQ